MKWEVVIRQRRKLASGLYGHPLSEIDSIESFADEAEAAARDRAKELRTSRADLAITLRRMGLVIQFARNPL